MRAKTYGINFLIANFLIANNFLFVFFFVYIGISSFIISLPLAEMILMIHSQKKMDIDIFSCVKIVNVQNILDFFNVKGF
jgi:hypothetical protein